MERELEKDLKEIEYLIYAHKERENTHTQSVLERAHEIIETCAKAARTLSELEELLSRENTPEITRSSRDNGGWIPVEEPPKKDYTAVFAVDKHDYYFVAVYDKGHGYRTNDVGADVDNIVAYCLFNLYRPERSNDEKE